jgi:hypothetical protein
MRQIRQVLPAAMESPEVLRVGRALAVMKRWDEVVGESLATRSWPDRYTAGTVWVAVEGAAWASELRMQKEKILRRLQEISGEPSLFSNVRFGQRKLPERPAFEKSQEASATPVIEEGPAREDLSIREIAERRLAKRRQSAEG